jgi:hypothetical protein
MRRCLRRGNYFQIIALPTSDGGLNSSGNLAMFAAIRLVSSRVNNFAADLRPGSSSK